MAQARAGLMSITGPPEGEPAKVGVPLCDLVCGLYLAMGVLAALHERARTGEGQTIDVSLLESGVSLAVWEAGRWFATGEVPQRLGSAHQSQAPYQAVRTADGWATLGAITPKTWAGMCRALGLTDLLEDDRFATSSSRHALREEVVGRVEGATSQLPTAEVVRGWRPRACRARRSRTSAGVHRRPPRGPRLLLGRAAPGRRPVRQLGSPMRFSRSATSAAGRPRPRHRDARGAAAGRLQRAGGRRPARQRRGGGAVVTDELQVRLEDGVLTVVFDRPAAATP
jgi:formyl-CoA transferase